MGLIRQVEVRRLNAMKSGRVEFFTPQTSQETMMVRVEAGAIEQLFVHHFQTDQLLVVRGQFVIVILQNRQYFYIPLSEKIPTVITIPPGVPHSTINLSDEPCLIVNAVLRHGEPHERDYRPLKPPFPYDLVAAKQALETLTLDYPRTA
ncbi:cupin domain-containing protein [Planktothrix mougeotii]|uniref:Cupin domain-containing protein n=1 Tax=Planktothrix mougeotii LEGE 06226 TaxID=1828728 RepID=A0ABR9U7T7_9CYAN|nr:cupin domain-containing protein [Planktothrix mougeotii]MBE9142204.1 cupin domain-containing protein [Planktothrix mougeotii LEGE 06226]